MTIINHFFLLKSLLTDAEYIFPGINIKSIVNKFYLVTLGMLFKSNIRQFYDSTTSSQLSTITKERRELLGALVWPYQCSHWGAKKRIERIVSHFSTLEKFAPWLRFSINERVLIYDLGEHYEGLKIFIDQPQWFIREGSLTINLFIDHFRAYSLAFSLHEPSPGNVMVTIGAVQGRNTPTIQEIYKNLSKAFHGLRPHVLLLEIFSMYCQNIGVKKILGVSEMFRHHYHPYFGGKKHMPSNYDEIWEEIGGVRFDKHFYEIPLMLPRRDISSIKSQKRSMYKKRYQFLDTLSSEISAAFPKVKIVQFEDS